MDDFDDSMDIDGAGDDGILSDKRTQTSSEDEEDSDESEDEDVEDTLRILTIDSGEEFAFEDEGEEEPPLDEEFEGMEDGVQEPLDEDEDEDLRLLLQQLKELSGTNYLILKANTVMQCSSEFGESLDYFHWKFKFNTSDNSFNDLIETTRSVGVPNENMAKFVDTCTPCSASKCKI